MKDFNLKKPTSVSGYPIHRAVAALTNGAPHLWRDNGDTLTIRTNAHLDAEVFIFFFYELMEIFFW